MKSIRLFLASSNDMIKFRDSSQKIVDELNLTIGEHFDVSIQLFRWEKKIVPSMGRPQQIIFDQSNFDNIDIFIGILGSRFGTPTGGYDSNNQEYESGTQEEYDRAYSNYRKTGRPFIMVFKNDAPLKPGTFDIEQYNKVQKFLEQFETSSKNPGIFCKFKSINDFQKEFRISLTKQILRIIDQNKDFDNDSPTILSKYYQSIGYQKMFVADTNSLRGIEKNNAISNSNIVYLLAKTGNSFLGSIGNRYLDLLISNAKKGSTVRILLLNPWSVSAVMTAFSESGDSELFVKLIKHAMPSQEVLEAYKKTKWFYSKLTDVMQEYSRLKTQYPQIELHFIDAEVPASILITDEYLFFEPYSNYCHTSRMSKKTSTFEICISKNNQLYSDSLQHFSLLWNLSISYEELMINENQYVNQLSNDLDAMYICNTLFYVGVHVMIRKGDQFLLLHRTDTKAYMPGKWDIPGGSMKAGETLGETARREVYEETGLKIAPGALLYAFSNPAELPVRQTIQVIMDAEYLGGDIQLNSREHSESKWVTKESAIELPLINFLESYINERIQ